MLGPQRLLMGEDFFAGTQPFSPSTMTSLLLNDTRGADCHALFSRFAQTFIWSPTGKMWNYPDGGPYSCSLGAVTT